VPEHQCIRIYHKEDGNLYFPAGQSSYGKDIDDMWFFKHKDEHAGTLFGTHTVVEHDDGTISVTPSIVGFKIHGYIEKGIWRDC
jgi:hypothetical protein